MKCEIIKQNKQFIMFPHKLGGDYKLTNLDRFVYILLKKYMNWDTYETFVSQTRLAAEAKTSQPTINKSLLRLEKSGEIIIEPQGKGRSNIYKIKKDNRKFEKFSYDFIALDKLSPELKGFYIMYQEYCYKDVDGYAKCTYTNYELCQKMKIDPHTLRKYFKELENLDIMTTLPTKVIDKESGLLRDMKRVDLRILQQYAIYVDNRFDKIEDRISAMEKNEKSYLEKIKRLERELYKATHTEEPGYKMI